MTEIEARLRAIETKGQELEKEMREQREKLEKIGRDILQLKRLMNGALDELERLSDDQLLSTASQ